MNKFPISKILEKCKSLFTFPKKKDDNQNIIYVWENKKLIAKHII